MLFLQGLLLLIQLTKSNAAIQVNIKYMYNVFTTMVTSIIYVPVTVHHDMLYSLS